MGGTQQLLGQPNPLQGRETQSQNPAADIRRAILKSDFEFEKHQSLVVLVSRWSVNRPPEFRPAFLHLRNKRSWLVPDCFVRTLPSDSVDTGAGNAGTAPAALLRAVVLTKPASSAYY
jgi:hypothetical protein